ncbi:MAG: YicC family protein [Pseudolabrys sp.]|nr:YicC family protein [Pseudolabrys sp.]
MALSSMTGFARGQGGGGGYAWIWEIKSVNAKGLDLRFRLPPGWDAIELPARSRAAAALARGTIHASLTIERRGLASGVRINEEVLAAVMARLKDLAARIGAAPPTLDGILSLKGIVEIGEIEEEDARRAAEAAIVEDFSATLSALIANRRDEGATLARLLTTRLAEINALVARAEAAPGRRPEAIRERMAAQIALLLDASDRFDADRLHQEAVLIASRSDIREELDRLAAHVAQAQRLLEEGGPVGRRLDFLAQEMHREANTLTAKSNDVELTKVGLELKAVVEQFREQVQNLE